MLRNWAIQGGPHLQFHFVRISKQKERKWWLDSVYRTKKERISLTVGKPRFLLLIGFNAMATCSWSSHFFCSNLLYYSWLIIAIVCCKGFQLMEEPLLLWSLVPFYIIYSIFKCLMNNVERVIYLCNWFALTPIREIHVQN